MAKDGPNLFDYLNAIYYKKDVEYDKKVANSYILTLWLSHDKTLVDMVNDINKHLFRLPDKAIFQYYWYNVPRGKRYIKFVKKPKQDKDNEKQVEELMKQYNISKREAELCLIN